MRKTYNFVVWWWKNMPGEDKFVALACVFILSLIGGGTLSVLSDSARYIAAVAAFWGLALVGAIVWQLVSVVQSGYQKYLREQEKLINTLRD